MKFNKFKKYDALALTTALSILTGCSYTGRTIESSTEVTLESENNVDMNSSELEEKKTKFVYKKGALTFTVKVDRYTLKILTDGELDKNQELPTEIYKEINEILTTQNIIGISLWYIGTEVDFTKLDLSNIEWLSIVNCKEDLEIASFTGNYRGISFIDVPSSVVEKVIQNCNYNNAYISISHSLDAFDNYNHENIVNVKKLSEYLIKNNIPLEALDIEQQHGISMTEEEISLLSKINTKSLRIEFEESREILNLDLEMNKNIESFTLVAATEFMYYSNWGSMKNSELGKVKITSKNFKLNCSFWYTNFTENTHLDLPEHANVELVGIDYTDIQPFYDLMNIQSLTYQPFFGHIYSFQENEIIYSYQKENDNFEQFIEQVRKMHEGEKIATYKN